MGLPLPGEFRPAEWAERTTGFCVSSKAAGRLCCGASKKCRRIQTNRMVSASQVALLGRQARVLTACPRRSLSVVHVLQRRMSRSLSCSHFHTPRTCIDKVHILLLNSAHQRFWISTRISLYIYRSVNSAEFLSHRCQSEMKCLDPTEQ